MKNRFFLALIFALSLVHVGCEEEARPSDPANVKNINSVMSTARVVDYHNGIYYFPFRMAEFGNRLSAFITQHGELKFLGCAASDVDAYGVTSGYFCFFEKRTPLPVDPFQ